MMEGDALPRRHQREMRIGLPPAFNDLARMHARFAGTFGVVEDFMGVDRASDVGVVDLGCGLGERALGLVNDMVMVGFDRLPGGGDQYLGNFVRTLFANLQDKRVKVVFRRPGASAMEMDWEEKFWRNYDMLAKCRDNARWNYGRDLSERESWGVVERQLNELEEEGKKGVYFVGNPDVRLDPDGWRDTFDHMARSSRQTRVPVAVTTSNVASYGQVVEMMAGVFGLADDVVEQLEEVVAGVNIQEGDGLYEARKEGGVRSLLTVERGGVVVEVVENMRYAGEVERSDDPDVGPYRQQDRLMLMMKWVD